MKANHVRVAILMMVSVAYVSGAAQAKGSAAFRAFLSYDDPTGSYTLQGVEFKADPAAGLDVYGEWLFNKRVGLEIGLRYVDYTINGSAFGIEAELGKVVALTVPLGLNVHVTSGKTVDFYLGPFAHYTSFGDLRSSSGNVATDSEFGFGGVLGLDARFGKSSWMFTSALRYMQLKAGDSSLKIDINPLMLDVGIGYHW